ncbi:MAG: Lrp/AsnC family transcriptional regulator [Faecalibacterium sp.]
MDKLDQKILALLAQNARTPVNEIAKQVALTSPAVSARIKKLEQDGIIAGYTLKLHQPAGQSTIDAMISVATPPAERGAMMDILSRRSEVLECYHVTGSHSFMIKVRCHNMVTLEQLILEFQTIGQTNTQIILSTPVIRNETAFFF